MKAGLHALSWNMVRISLVVAVFLGLLAFCLWPVSSGGLPRGVTVSDLRVLEDKDNTVEAGALLQQPQAFRTAVSGKIALGHGESTLWCLLDVTNLGDKAQTLYLNVDNPGVDDLVLHVAHGDGRVDAATAGDMHAGRPVPEAVGHAFPFALAGGERATLLLRSRTSVGSQLIPVRVLDRDGLDQTDHTKTFIHGGMLGLLLALLMSSVLLARSLRDDAYGYYAGYLLCAGVVTAGLTGAGYTTFWPGNIWMSNQGLMVFEALGKVFLLLFSQRFLDGDGLPDVRRLLRLGLGVAAALLAAVLALSPFYAYKAAIAVLLALPGLTLWAGISAWRRGRPHAFFYIAGQVVVWLGMWTYMLIDWGVVRGTGLVFEIVPFSICLDALLLNMALADKLTMRQGETLRLEVEARKSLETRREELERLVEIRTAELAKARDRAEDLARTDALTGVYNRRHMKEIGGREFARSVRYETPLALVVFDIDNFKTVNDSFGHDEGDRVLLRIAETVGGNIRQTDVFFRWGGEEFLLLLPDTTLDEAVLLTERLRREVERSVRAGAEGQPVTASFGVAVRLPDDDTLSRCITRADKALYAAKACGRNRVECMTA